MRKQEKVKKMSELLKIFVSAEYARLVREIVAKKSSLTKTLGQMVRISQKVKTIFKKNLLRNTTLCANSTA